MPLQQQGRSAQDPRLALLAAPAPQQESADLQDARPGLPPPARTEARIMPNLGWPVDSALVVPPPRSNPRAALSYDMSVSENTLYLVLFFWTVTGVYLITLFLSLRPPQATSRKGYFFGCSVISL